MAKENKNSKNKDEELRDVEVWEFSLSAKEIVELIGKLNELRVTKESVTFEVNEDNEILIHYVDEENTKEFEVPVKEKPNENSKKIPVKPAREIPDKYIPGKNVSEEIPKLPDKPIND